MTDSDGDCDAMVVMHYKLLGGVFVVRAEVVRGVSCLDLIAREMGKTNYAAGEFE